MSDAVRRGGRLGLYLSIVPIVIVGLLLWLDHTPLFDDGSFQVMLIAVVGATVVIQSAFIVLVIAQGGAVLNLEHPNGVLLVLALLLVAEPALFGAVVAFLVHPIAGGLLAVCSPALWLLTNTLAARLASDVQ